MPAPRSDLHRRSRTRFGGFSLLEVLCAVVILGVGLAGITEAITVAVSSSKRTEQLTIAPLLAAGHLETLRADGWLVAGENEGDFGDEFANYSWRERITATTLDGLFDVVVSIHWQDTERPLYELRTLLFDVPFSSLYDSDKDETKRPGWSDRERTRRARQRGIR